VTAFSPVQAPAADDDGPRMVALAEVGARVDVEHDSGGRHLSTAAAVSGPCAVAGTLKPPPSHSCST
jgi:hypothetical protein